MPTTKNTKDTKPTMWVIFRRTGTRRYGIEARREQYPDVGMNPAPGYDPLVPHDLLHMVVEAELGLSRGVFGQLAAGGDAGTFGIALEATGDHRADARAKRRVTDRGKKLQRQGHDESALSERASYICWYEWLARSELPERQRMGRTMAEQARQVRDTCTPNDLQALREDAILRICTRLDAISVLWAALDMGEGIEVGWPDLTATTARNPEA